MSIAYRVQDYIAARDLPWDPVAHRASNSCMEAARFAHVPPDRLAKAVVLEDRDGYIVAVIPANHRVDLPDLAEKLHRELSLASERELQGLFSDCAPGAVPPLGEAYGIPTVWEESLAGKPEIYFEGGDHRTLVHMSGPDFCELMSSARPFHHY